LKTEFYSKEKNGGFGKKVILINLLRCDGCGSCVAVCPGNGLTLNGKGLTYSEEDCLFDLKCLKACPLACLEVLQDETTL
jgi:NAD-dependent dihydropyrimidine dehydrogenase PreA subunit